MTTNQPADHLLEVLLGILTPILMTGGVTDPGLARLAAQEAIAAGRTDAQASLMTIAQTVGFAITSLDNLRLSASSEVSLSMKLKLRGNANALSRSAHRASTAESYPITADPEDATQAEDDGPAREAALATLEQAKAAVQQSIPQTAPNPDRQRERLWANAMTEVAAECSAPRRDHSHRRVEPGGPRSQPGQRAIRTAPSAATCAAADRRAE
jgi:hypothetical protein